MCLELGGNSEKGLYNGIDFCKWCLYFSFLKGLCANWMLCQETEVSMSDRGLECPLSSLHNFVKVIICV